MTPDGHAYLPDLKRHLRQLRKATGLTQKRVGELIGRDKETIYRLESDKWTGAPGTDTLVKVAQVYGMTHADLVGLLLHLGADGLAADIAEYGHLPAAPAHKPRDYDFVVRTDNGIEIAVEVKAFGYGNNPMYGLLAERAIAEAIKLGRPRWRVDYDLSSDASIEALERELRDLAQRPPADGYSSEEEPPDPGQSLTPDQ